jgi:alpha-tubulin suppressor-like RCC1 family protein
MARHTPKLTHVTSLLLLALAACEEQPAGIRLPPRPDAPENAVARIQCTVDVRLAALACEQAGPGAEGGAARLAMLTVGGQHQYVRLANLGNVYDAQTGIFSTSVTVQNLLAAALGTADGSTASPLGVRVFFYTGPTAPVTVANADGTGLFTAPDQPYFQYFGLGGDGMLAPGEISEAKTWRFATNGAASFSFSVYVQAAVPDGAASTLHFTQISTGDMHSCGVEQRGMVYCWGSGAVGTGQSNSGSFVPRPILAPAGVSFRSTASGGHYTCALTTTGRVFCWGSAPGETSVGVPGSNRLEPQELTLPPGVAFTRLAAGVGFACALDEEGAAYCWGGNGQGQLGNGTLLPYEAMTPEPVSMPAGVTFTAISATASHACALGSDSEAYCWGHGSSGQIGNGLADFNNPSPTRVPRPQSEPGFSVVAAGGYHTCAVGLSGQGYCWGRGWVGQLGNGTAPDIGPAAPSPVQMPPGVTFTDIAAGQVHSCALGSDGKAYCWGEDLFGQLGNGPGLTANQLLPSAVQMPPGVAFTRVEGSSIHTCAWGTGAAYCWGENHFAMLGDGTDIDRPAPAVVAGTR